MLWSTLSNAADRSSKVNTARLPESSARSMSAKTFRIAVSVEWYALAVRRLKVWKKSIVGQVLHQLLSTVAVIVDVVPAAIDAVLTRCCNQSVTAP